MKKLSLFLCMMLLVCIGASAFTAEEISGCRWKSKAYNIPAEAGIPGTQEESYVFNVDGNVEEACNIKFTLPVAQGIEADAFIDLSVKGKYLILGNVISINYDTSTIVGTFDEDEIRIRGVEDATVEDQIRQQLVVALKQIIDMLKTDIGSVPKVLKNVVVEDKKMTLEDEGQQLTFTKKKL